jgi:hypothetical protein
VITLVFAIAIRWPCIQQKQAVAADVIPVGSQYLEVKQKWAIDAKKTILAGEHPKRAFCPLAGQRQFLHIHINLEELST